MQYKPVIVAYENNSPVHLDELGDVIDSVEDDKTGSWFYNKDGNERAILLSIQRQPGTNTVEVAENVKKLLPVFRTELPPSVKMNVFYDRSKTIKESYDDVKFTMLLTLGLVIMVIFVFLRNFSATLIPSLALPFSVVGTFAVMYLLGYSLDNLSMMALILAVGFVVDDAIVMLENIVRHMEMGKPAMQAALEGSKEIGFTIVSMTISLAAVFIPVLFMGGVLGRLFREFAVTICASILISGVVSVTLTPMMCSRFLRSSHENRRSWFYRVTEAFFDWMLHIYDVGLVWVLRHRFVTLISFFLVLAGTGLCLSLYRKGLCRIRTPISCRSLRNPCKAPASTQMSIYQRRVAELVNADPDVDSLVATVGGRRPLCLVVRILDNLWSI